MSKKAKCTKWDVQLLSPGYIIKATTQKHLSKNLLLSCRITGTVQVMCNFLPYLFSEKNYIMYQSTTSIFSERLLLSCRISWGINNWNSTGNVQLSFLVICRKNYEFIKVQSVLLDVSNSSLGTWKLYFSKVQIITTKLVLKLHRELQNALI